MTQYLDFILNHYDDHGSLVGVDIKQRIISNLPTAETYLEKDHVR